MFSNKTPAKLNGSPPLLQVVIDTEEDFDWNAPPDRQQTSVDSMNYIDRVQDIFNDYGIVPCYVIDYPIASQEDGVRLLKQYHAAGQAEIGAHLHPWVNPPHNEQVTVSNMYPGNLPAELERAKLTQLRDKIAEQFGQVPRAYKAGRYGFGPNTQATLAALGFDIDLSVSPSFDHRYDGGPDYSDYNAEPFFFGDGALEVPITGAFVGWTGGLRKPLFNLGQKLSKVKGPGIASRLGLSDRIALSPEGYGLDEHIKITKFLRQQGVNTFTWSFHSPSVKPGCTPYVRTEKDLQAFLDNFRRYFDFFLHELGGKPTSPTQLKTLLETK